MVYLEHGLTQLKNDLKKKFNKLQHLPVNYLDASWIVSFFSIIIYFYLSWFNKQRQLIVNNPYTKQKALKITVYLK